MGKGGGGGWGEMQRRRRENGGRLRSLGLVDQVNAQLLDGEGRERGGRVGARRVCHLAQRVVRLDDGAPEGWAVVLHAQRGQGGADERRRGAQIVAGHPGGWRDNGHHRRMKKERL